MQGHSYWAGNYWKIEEEEEISEDDGLNDLLANVAQRKPHAQRDIQSVGTESLVTGVHM